VQEAGLAAGPLEAVGGAAAAAIGEHGGDAEREGGDRLLFRTATALSSVPSSPTAGCTERERRSVATNR
jgi:hypothetical protein